MITTFMAAFAFGYCVADIAISFYNNKRDNELMKSIVDQELNR
jgi:hypothetical protein